MSFRTNESQQMSLTDRTLFGLTAREKKALEHSWAKVFADDIFPSIDEKPFAVLYSNKASRPNTPVNVIIGALILKELFDLSDDDVVEDILLDPRFQYALHTTSFQEQPISDKTLTRFRQRCYDYEELHGVDLYHDCVKDLAEKTARLMKIDGRIRRMDSMMVEANIRKLSRAELIYRSVAKWVTWLHKNGRDDLIQGYEHYYDPNDYNQVFYHNRSSELDNGLGTLLKDADALLKNSGYGFCGITEYDLFVRVLSEQTTIDEYGIRSLREKGDAILNSSIVQSPTDPDATYREKAGHEHRGYVANVEESVSKNGSQITDYRFEKNTKSDSAMFKEHLDDMGQQDEEVTIVTDGAYCGAENQEKAAENNVKLITTDLTGKEVPEIIGKFELNEEGTRVLKCPAGYAPKSTSYIRQTGTCTASFSKNCCENCPHRGECHAKICKRVAKVRVSGKSVARAKLQVEMKTDIYKEYGRFRNGVETVPSILRNVFHADRMPVSGLIRNKFFFGSKVAALNFRKLFRYRHGLGSYAQNPVIA